ncbi:MAG: hypothetical protein M3N24_07465, partial [Actinomycetota bacterium]|nr:hypothetical protein [Actinomycetota bacterium]
MATTPREPRFRIVFAVILTAAVGGMFLAGDSRHQGGEPLSSAPADQRVAQEPNAAVATAPSPDEILTFTGRDPFDRGRTEKKPPQDSPATPPSTPVAQGVTSSAPSAGVTVSVGSAATPQQEARWTRKIPVGSREEDDDGDVVAKVPGFDEPAPVDPALVNPVPVDDGVTRGAGSAEPDDGVYG